MPLSEVPFRQVEGLLDAERNWEWLKNLQLGADDLEDDAVGSAALADNSVTNAALADGVVTNTELAGGVKNYGIVTALPGSPVTGDQCTYVNSLTVPTYRWQLQYNGSDSGSYKWECIGGDPLTDNATGSVNTTSGSFVSLGSDDVAITVPLAGDYKVEVGGQMFNSALDGYAYMDYTGGGHTASTNDAASVACTNAGHGPVITVRNRPTTATGMAASGVITSKYAVSGSTGTYALRWMEAMPVRVG